MTNGISFQTEADMNARIDIKTVSAPKLLLHLEGLALLLVAIALYAHTAGNGIAFVLLLLTPDVAIVGYLVNARVGSMTYNAVHTMVLPLTILAVAVIGGWLMGTHLALIWLAHIGMDRSIGYGLKYASGFHDTHLQRV
jgi:hypothetical protein